MANMDVDISFFFYHPSLNHIYPSVYNCICTVISRRRRTSRVDQDDGNGDNDAVEIARSIDQFLSIWRFFIFPKFKIFFRHV